ncbi:MAG TPA: hypothetical protein IAA57_08330 [Candidatus Pullilachnospira intestinigallinarum]|nr:hypothetical protein [Candidatus Pullilachnospira intestinigallinarum]
MKKLRTVVQYECATSFKYIWIFYAVVFAVIAVISAIIFLVEGSMEQVGTNCLEMNSLVYVGILGALGFKEDFRMLIQNGFTRTYIFLATLSLFGFVSGILALVDTIVGRSLHALLPGGYDSVFGSIYGYEYSPVLNWLWLFLVYLTVCCLFYLVILVINRLGKVSSVTLGVALAMVIVLVLPAVFRFLLPAGAAGQMRRFLMGAMGFPRGGGVNLLFPLLFFLAVFLLLGAASYLVIRRAELKV